VPPGRTLAVVANWQDKQHRGATTARGRGAAHARVRARGFNKGFKTVLIARELEKVVKNQ